MAEKIEIKDIDLKDFDVVDSRDFILLKQHIKAMGEDAAKKMLVEAKKKFLPVNQPSKVYINVYGAEVHVNGPVAVPVSKPETLAQKIARFERLAASVRAQRQLMVGLAQDMLTENETDEEADKAMEEVESVDEFGDSFVVKTQQKLSFAEQKNADAESIATDNIGEQAQIIDGDEPSQTTAPAKQSDMVEQENDK